MDKAMFEEMLASTQEMDRMLKGKIKPSRRFDHPEPEVKNVREKTGLSQLQFSVLIGVSKRTLENWEQGRRHPTGPAKALLRIVEANPEVAMKALYG